VAKPRDDPLTEAERTLLADLASQAGIALRNVQLAAELEVSLDRISGQAEELRRSSQRIVEAQDEERRRVERDLHDGAQQRLVALAVTLRTAMNRLSASEQDDLATLLQTAAEDVKHAHSELRDLARGLYPMVLTERGLRSGVDGLVQRLPIRVEADVTSQRFRPGVESTAYFVVGEALTNVVKHAGASTVFVRAGLRDDVLVVEVCDDGRGGASAAGGSGLRGLADRVAALGGTFAIEDIPSGGTRVVAELPCA
jgi:signal transduction histidine kinase